MKKYLTASLAATFVVMGVAAVSAQEEKKAWTDTISFNGDLRLRHEWIDKEGSDVRNRWRIRARLGMSAKPTDTVAVKARFASGSDDPTSSNQTLDDGFTTKDFGLDRFYLDWTPESLGGTHLLGGKMKNPFVRTSDLVWDGDLNPEGLAVQQSMDVGGSKLMFNGGAFQADERSSDDETFLYGGQLAGEFNVGDDMTLTAGSSYFLWDNMDGFAPLVDEEDSFGNTTRDIGDEENPSLVYANDFGELEFFTTLKMDVGLPLKLFGNYVLNTEADDNDTGFLFGASLGAAKEPGSYAFAYDYRDVEADAVVGAFTDSDSFGGGTNGEGHRFKVKYQVAKNLQAGAAYFLNSIDPDGDDKDFDRLQVNLIAKF